MDELLKQEGYDLMSAAFEVYNHMGSGFLEEVYQQCLEREFEMRGVPFEPRREIVICYKGEPLDKRYIPDFVVHRGIIVELKAAKALAPEHEAQLLNYLKATGMRVGYLLNFGAAGKLEWKRMVK